ncbi:MAG: phosphatase PAP2 family protein [Burkholderiales bacterium]
MKPKTRLALALGLCHAALAHAAGGPLGIDHRIGFDQSGIWSRHDQLLLQDLALVGVVGGALWEGGDSRLGRTYWQALDASVLGAAAATAAKEVFTRARPGQIDDPNKWFQGKGHYSFPSGEVTFISAAITPFVLEYGADHPGTYALEVLPLYDGIARMKSQAHWQTDVLAGFALGSAAGYYAHKRSSPFFL